jgi:hypothetical protein
VGSNRGIGVDIYGNASGYVSAVNATLRATTRMSQGFRSMTRESQLLGNQMKAMSTMIRYAVAGQIVFGITGAIAKLNQFNQQLGTINSLATRINQQGQITTLGGKLEDVGSEAILLSNKLGIAVGDIEQYMGRFASAFDLSGSKSSLRDLREYVSTVAGLQAYLGSEAGDPQALSGAIAGFVNAIPGGRQNVGATTNRVANLIAYLTAKTPNITGRDISRDIGRMSAAMNATNMTPEQVFGVWGAAGGVGGSASMLGRGVAQLLTQSLVRPTTKPEKEGFSAMGLPTDPTALRNMGGINVLMQMLQHVERSGGRITNRAATRGGDLATLQSSISGVDITPIYQAFGRIQSVQQFLNLLSQGGSKALRDWIKSLKEAETQNVHQARVNAAMQKRGLAQYQQSFSNLGLSLARSVDPLYAGPGTAVKFLSDEAARHRTGTSVVTSTALGLAAGRALGRLGLFNKPLGYLDALAGQSGAAGPSRMLRFGRGALRFLGGASRAEQSGCPAGDHGRGDGQRAQRSGRRRLACQPVLGHHLAVFAVHERSCDGQSHRAYQQDARRRLQGSPGRDLLQGRRRWHGRTRGGRCSRDTLYQRLAGADEGASRRARKDHVQSAKRSVVCADGRAPVGGTVPRCDPGCSRQGEHAYQCDDQRQGQRRPRHPAYRRGG